MFHRLFVYPVCSYPVFVAFLCHPWGISMEAVRVLGYNVHGHDIHDVIPLLSPPRELKENNTIQKDSYCSS